MNRPLTPKEVAILAGLHIETVRAYIRAGRLPAERIGWSYLIAREDAAKLAADPPRPGRPSPRRPLVDADGRVVPLT